MDDRNYWMFRVSNKWGNKTDACLKDNMVYCGWFDLINDIDNLTYEKKHKEHEWLTKRSFSMAFNFTKIKERDIIVLPISHGIAIGEAGEKVLRKAPEWPNGIKVEWKKTFYPRKDLSAWFQQSLKYRGTFLDLHKHKNELDNLINSKFDNLTESFQDEKIKIATKVKQDISKHINSRKNLNFQDREFEDFIMHLLELNYDGIKGIKNNQKQEAKDGKDLTMSVDYDDFDINIQINVQVKQHEDMSPEAGIDQIAKSSQEEETTKNVLVTTGTIDHLKDKADEKQIILIGPEQIAEMIYDNFENIEEMYQSKLNLFSKIDKIDIINN